MNIPVGEMVPVASVSICREVLDNRKEKEKERNINKKRNCKTYLKDIFAIFPHESEENLTMCKLFKFI